MNKTISIFGWDVEEQVMETLVFKMKTSCTPSDLYKRMYIGFGEHILEITERSILRMRENSIFFRICWEELQGCYGTVKPYMNYTPEPMKGKCENDPITLASSSDEYEPVREEGECDSELAGLDYEAGPEPVKVKVEDGGAATSAPELDYEAINLKIGNIEREVKRMKEDIKLLKSARKASVDNRRSPSHEPQGVSSSKAALLYCRGPQSKFEVRNVARWQDGDLLAICPKTSRGGKLYYILVVRERIAGQIVDEINDTVYNGQAIKMQYANVRGLDIGHLIRNYGGISFNT